MLKEEFIKGIAVLEAGLGSKLKVDNKEAVGIWYQALKRYSYETFTQAICKIMLNETYPPTIATINKYCSEIENPLEATEEDAWELVIKGIRKFGMYRKVELMNSLPANVQKAVKAVGGIDIICTSEEPNVVQGQFYRAIKAVNEKELRARRTPSESHMLLEHEQKEIDALPEYTRSQQEDTDKSIALLNDTIKNLTRGMEM